MTRVRVGLFAATVAFAVDGVGADQEKGQFVVVSDASGMRGGFQPDAQPRDVTKTIARVGVMLLQRDVRLADGQIVTGFGFDGWAEGEGVRVVVTALLPADGTNRYLEMKPGMRPSFRKQEFARLTLSPGEKRPVEEMKALGIEPLIVRRDTSRRSRIGCTDQDSQGKVDFTGPALYNQRFQPVNVLPSCGSGGTGRRASLRS